MLKEFREFILRGNVMDLAVGVIIGSAFTAIVTSLVKNLINPLIGIFLGRIDLSNLVFKVGDATFRYGAFLNSVINFLIIALVVFLLMKSINTVMEKAAALAKSEEDAKEAEEEEKEATETDYLKQIVALLEKQDNK
ncbi:large-conductance mechanosensitive channel protein MscL [Limosilactobacillus gastricus]|uniref:Large-conductance mechanosensitive channel n=1 Tax=Limosilactobacillus gastricus DSM 16045 TaxID=1423749 RepID=A0A0R1VCC7_9LACO|nr:large-conductance mechanosensitive channel protein MscL [Limosilactobacillus gastricus]KRM03150.1 Large conductance mechanosensitive channel protein [Limosilactobacillus gastricus DSM 16045]QGF40515.1 large-conductance mechanosensitive channel protein MscL [Limosilactobacillus gastricus]